ncbi:MAG TPA: right-handed parallel beta-helix repeat-containing protein [Pyrinomonadaceae bacterium]|jgi:hypothetical protein
MNTFRPALHFVAALALVAFCTSLTQAQALRTWVSGTGDDANPCSRTAPCKTFAGAVSKTAINGEIDALDPAGFGSVTLTKSMTIDGTGTFAGIAAAIGNGIVVVFTDPTNDPLKTVRLRGISINGTNTVGGAGTQSGLRGIYVSPTSLGQPKVIVQDCIVDGFTLDGILFNANGGDLVVTNTISRNNVGAGIKLDSAGGNLVHGTIENTKLIFNGDGLRIEDNVRAGVKDSVMSSNTGNGIAAINVSSSAVVQVMHSLISENRQNGLVAGGNITFSTIQIAESMIIHNNVGVAFSDANGKINSWGNNYLSINGTNGTFTTSTVPFN